MTDLRDRPLFICGHPKSGTSLLRSLLDSHPQVITYPEETNFFRRFLPEATGKTLEEKLVCADKFLTQIFEWSVTNPPEHQKDFPDRDYSHIAVDDVRREMRAYITQQHKHDGDFLSASVLAFGKVSGCLTDRSVRWVEKTPMNELYADQIFTWWPAALCIHLVRDPRDNFASYRRKQEKWDAEKFAVNWRRSTQVGLRNENHYGKEKYLLIRYEDFTNDPEVMLRKICRFLNINDDLSLRTPKRGGKEWRGNSMFSEKFEGISNAPVGRWRESLTLVETAVIETIDRVHMQRLGYSLSGAGLGNIPLTRRLKVIQKNILIKLKENLSR